MVDITRPDEPKTCCGVTWVKHEHHDGYRTKKNFYLGMKALSRTPERMLRMGIGPQGFVFICDHCKVDGKPLTQCDGCAKEAHSGYASMNLHSCRECGCALRLSRTDFRRKKDRPGHLCSKDPQYEKKMKVRHQEAAAKVTKRANKVLGKLGINKDMMSAMKSMGDGPPTEESMRRMWTAQGIPKDMQEKMLKKMR